MYVEDQLCVELQRLQKSHFSLKNTQELWNQKTTCMLRPYV